MIFPRIHADSGDFCLRYVWEFMLGSERFYGFITYLLQLIMQFYEKRGFETESRINNKCAKRILPYILKNYAKTI